MLNVEAEVDGVVQRWTFSNKEARLLRWRRFLLGSCGVLWILYLGLGFEEADLVDEQNSKTGKNGGFIWSYTHDRSHSEMVFLSPFDAVCC